MVQVQRSEGNSVERGSRSLFTQVLEVEFGARLAQQVPLSNGPSCWRGRASLKNK